MNPDLSKKISSKIELLCESGCTQVSQLLEKASNGNELVELAEFSPSEIKQIIDELGKIMAVYKTSDADDCDG
ncbi:MAG: hypothetical protein BMS9Abin19_0427 [Gammaproteobacteria bacterium]|nr:MAG: hypothetical protein BMS9Abin19_0427 [Gammaproteobacteria bacterium]